MSFLDKLKEMAEKLIQPKPPFDPTRFNDPLAEKVGWGPAKSGGTNIGTHSLRVVSRERAEFRAKGVALIFPGVFILVGLGMMVGMTVGGIRSGEYVPLAVGIPFGLVFFLVGFLIYRSWTTPRVFDRRVGRYWRGRQEPMRGMRDEGAKEQCRLEDIHAIQLLSEYCRGNKTSYYSYELNLVLQDGSRINVVDHGNHRLIRDDAQRLAEFLEVPVWDAS